MPLYGVDPYGEFFPALAIPALPSLAGWAGGIVGVIAGAIIGDQISDILLNEDANNGDNPGGDCSKSSSDKNTNPYKGPVDDSVIAVDPAGNAIPVAPGQQIQTSPNGGWVSIQDANGRPSGIQIHGGHRPSTQYNLKFRV
jgi:hypothetical protein